jgi:hypothetical protein
MTIPLIMIAVAGFLLSTDFSKDHPQAPGGPKSGQSAKEDNDWQFARHLASAIKVIEQDHVKPTKDVQLIQWAVEGLYKELDKPVPTEIAKRVKNLEKANQEDRLLLLHDVRADLGRRKDLENDKDLELSLQAIFLQLEPGARPLDRSGLYRQEYT